MKKVIIGLMFLFSMSSFSFNTVLSPWIVNTSCGTSVEVDMPDEFTDEDVFNAIEIIDVLECDVHIRIINV